MAAIALDVIILARGEKMMVTRKTAQRPAPQAKEPTPDQIKAILNFVLATNEPALRALAHR